MAGEEEADRPTERKRDREREREREKERKKGGEEQDKSPASCCDTYVSTLGPQAFQSGKTVGIGLQLAGPYGHRRDSKEVGGGGGGVEGSRETQVAAVFTMILNTSIGICLQLAVHMAIDEILKKSGGGGGGGS